MHPVVRSFTPCVFRQHHSKQNVMSAPIQTDLNPNHPWQLSLPARQHLGDLCPAVAVHVVCFQQYPVLLLTEAFSFDVVTQLVHPTQPAGVQHSGSLLAAGSCKPAQGAAHVQHSSDLGPCTDNVGCVCFTAFSCLSQPVSSVLKHRLCSRQGWAAWLLLCCWAPGCKLARA